MFANECAVVPDADIVIQALCTAPFIDERCIANALDKLLSSQENDSLVTVTEAKQYTWSGTDPDYGRGRIPNSTDLQVIIEAMSLYMVRRNSSDFPKKRYGSKPILHVLSTKEAVDINYIEDLELAEMVCRGERMTEANYFSMLRHHLSSSIISDVTKGNEAFLHA